MADPNDQTFSDAANGGVNQGGSTLQSYTVSGVDEGHAGGGGGAADPAGGDGEGVREGVKREAGKLRGQATDKAQELARAGKEKATEKLDGVSKLIDDAATQVDEKLGEQYGKYARDASSAVQGFSDTLRGKDIEDLLADARAFVRKSPVVAVGAAAAIGFVLARLARAGYEATEEDVDQA